MLININLLFDLSKTPNFEISVAKYIWFTISAIKFQILVWLVGELIFSLFFLVRGGLCFLILNFHLILQCIRQTVA